MRTVPPKSKHEILQRAIPMFAESGFKGVTMRAIAGRVGLTAASLYHHFPDKESLYLAALKQAFADRSRALGEALTAPAPPAERLRLLILRPCERMQRDSTFTRLVQREILDGDEKRLRLVAKQVFHEVFAAITALCRELAPACDSFLLSTSIIGLVVHYYQFTPIRSYLPGSRPEYDQAATVARHITTLLLNGINLKQESEFRSQDSE